MQRFEPFKSRLVTPRPVDVWLPPGYDEQPSRRYPVLYAQDGQNLFLPELSFSGVDWGVDEILVHLAAEIELPIVVGIWNTPGRIAEYMPEKPMRQARARRRLERFAEEYGQAPCSDAYLRHLVTEIKPFVDARYRTRTDPENTFVMGSSMGALFALYALCERPDVFGGAACLSTSWTVGGSVMIPYLRRAIPPAGTHRVYFDYGDEARLGRYVAYQERADRLFDTAGYVPGVQRETKAFPGADHSEAAWRDRLYVPLRFLLRAASEPPQANPG